MSEPAQICEKNAIVEQNFSLKLLIAFKTVYSSYFSLIL